MCTIYIESQKMVAMADTRSLLCLHRIAWPRIKQRVASYQTNKVIAHQKPKKWLSWQRPLGAGYRQYLHSVGGPLKSPPSGTINPNGIAIGSAVFAQMTAECPYTLQWDALCPLKIAPSHGKIWTPIEYVVPNWPTRVLNQNGISIGAVVFAGLTSVTDRQTDRQTTLVGR